MLYKKNEEFDKKAVSSITSSIKEVLTTLNENPEREGLLKTPERVAKSLIYNTQGYNIDPVEIIKSALFNEDHEEMIIVKDIELYSMCEHHMLPFYGKAFIGYLPNGKITGLSKLARVVDVYSRRLQVQERLTEQISKCLTESLNPHGVAVVIEAKHLCMMMRGVQKQNSITTTSSFTGAFLNSESTRKEFLSLIGKNLI